MNELLKQISSYHLFNYLLPGCIFAAIAEHVTPWHFIETNVVLGLFLYYAYGLAISRVGALIVSPILRKTQFLKHARYRDFVVASKADPKIDVLSETNNMYRSLCGLLLILCLLCGIARLEHTYSNLVRYNKTVIFISVTLLLLFSYRRQTSFISERVRVALEDK